MKLSFEGEYISDIITQMRYTLSRIDAQPEAEAQPKPQPDAAVAETPVHKGATRAPKAEKPAAEKNRVHRTKSTAAVNEEYTEAVADSRVKERAGLEAPEVPAVEKTTGAQLEYADKTAPTEGDAVAALEHLYNSIGGNDEAAAAGREVLSLFGVERFREFKTMVGELSEEERTGKLEIFIDECNKRLAAYKKARK